MTYDIQKRKPGREFVSILELFLPICTRVYGTSPCTAAKGSTGTEECFNTYKTCQDKANYNSDSTKPYRFCSKNIPGLQAAGEQTPFPVLLNVETTPTKLDPGKSLGLRSTVTCTLQDFPWPDQGTDPYVNSRTYNPRQQGSFFGKLLARFPYHESKKVILRTGFLTDGGRYDSNNFISREFISFRFSGPDSTGRVTFEAKDLLKYADREKVKCPAFSAGKLSGNHSDITTTLQLETGQVPSYNVDDYIRIEKEVLLITGKDIGLDQLTVTRATLPAIYPANAVLADSHRSGATVQICKWFDAVPIEEIVYYLLVDVAGISASYITFTDWQTVAADWFSGYDFSALITEPVGTGQLLEELCEHLVLLWWDERDQKIRFDALRPATNSGIITFCDSSSILTKSFSSTQDTAGRVSQVFIRYGQLNPTEKLKEPTNFQAVEASVDLEASSVDKYGSASTRDLYSRWLPVASRLIAFELAGRLLLEYVDTKRVVQFEIDLKDDDISTGDRVQLDTRYIQNETGANSIDTYLILEVEEQVAKDRILCRLTCQSVSSTRTCAIIGPNTLPDYLLATSEERRYGFTCDTTTEKMSNGNPPYVIC